MRSLFPLFLFIFGYIGLSNAQHIHTCTVMPVGDIPNASSNTELPLHVLGAVSYKPKLDFYWPQGSTLKVKFMGGSAQLRSRVMKYANTWTKYANVNFKVVTSGSADIRVGFVQNGASWSIVGKRALYASQHESTMNFGWLTDATPEYEVRRTVLHEFGHALGLLHEHQNPAGGIPWDEDAVYSYYQRTQGWGRQTTYDNVMSTVSKNVSQYSAYDEASIMHYPISPYLTGGRYEVGMNETLSPTDKSYIAMLYPGRNVADTGGTTTKPPTKVNPKPKSQQRYQVNVNNSLGENQKSEIVHLYVKGKKYVLQLSKDGTTQKSISLNLPKGEHNYRLATSSVYFGYRRVRNGHYTTRKYVEKTIKGSGSGQIVVDGNEKLILYGRYDKDSQMMEVYLGDEAESQRVLAGNR